MKKTLFVLLLMTPMFAGAQADLYCDSTEVEYHINLNLENECVDELGEKAFLMMFDSNDIWVQHFPYVSDTTDSFVTGDVRRACLVPGGGYHMITIVSESCIEWDEMDDVSVVNSEDGSETNLTVDFLSEPEDAISISLDDNMGSSFRFNAPSITSVPAVGCPGDLNADGIINSADLLMFLSLFGSSCK